MQLHLDGSATRDVGFVIDPVSDNGNGNSRYWVHAMEALEPKR